MSELSAWDLDGTIRPGLLVADIIAFGAKEGFIDIARFDNPQRPTMDEIHYFIDEITHTSRTAYRELTDKLSDEAPLQAFPWAIDRLSQQEHPVIFSQSPDFIVKAFARGLPNVRHARGSFYHTQGNVFSGRGVTLHKLQAISRYQREKQLPLLSFAAGDSLADVPMLKRAQSGVIVNPDNELQALAEQHNWEVVTT